MDSLFNANGKLEYLFQSYEAKIKGKVEALSADIFSTNSDERITEHLAPDFYIEPLRLYPESAVITAPAECKVDMFWDMKRVYSEKGAKSIDGIYVTLQIPYTGPLGLWQFAPRQQHTGGRPVGTVFPDPQNNQTGFVAFSIALPADIGEEAMAEQMKTFFAKQKQDVLTYTQWQKEDIERYNTEIKGNILEAVTARREYLNTKDKLAGLLNIPLQPNPQAPPILPVKLQPRATVALTPPPKSGIKPEPGIDNALYEKILQIIRHEGRSFETTPATFHKLDEEELRDVLLAHLRGHFGGLAGAEAFRSNGKTDILIQQDDRSAFVAECKIWGGSGQVAADIEQLLSYLVWRDCKASLIVFNKTVSGFTHLQSKLPGALTSHGLLVKPISVSEQGEWRFVFRSVEDEGREVTVHVFLFNIYQTKK